MFEEYLFDLTFLSITIIIFGAAYFFGKWQKSSHAALFLAFLLFFLLGLPLMLIVGFTKFLII